MTRSSWQREVFIFSPSDRRWQLHRCPQHERIYLCLFGHVCWRLRSRVWVFFYAELAAKGSHLCFTRRNISHTLWYWMHKYMYEYRSKRKACLAQSCYYQNSWSFVGWQLNICLLLQHSTTMDGFESLFFHLSVVFLSVESSLVYPPPPPGMCEYEWLPRSLWVCEQCLK